MRNNLNRKVETTECLHKNKTHEGGYVVCQDCGLILEELDFADPKSSGKDFGSDSQFDYEKKIKISDSKAIQDPRIKERYEKIIKTDKWYKDYKSSFTEQKKTIEQLKMYDIGLEIDNAKFQNIKKRYLKFNRKDRKTYQNMVIIFLALVWDEIKDTTNVRIDKFIEVSSNQLGHKINKKMLINAMHKVKRAEIKRKQEKLKNSEYDLETEIKNKIKRLIQKNLNNIPFEKVKEQIPSEEEFHRIIIKVELRANELLDKIKYEEIQNLNIKAFTAGLIYYIGQMLYNRKIFTQQLIYKTTDFSSTTIRKKYKILKTILGEPERFPVLI